MHFERHFSGKNIIKEICVPTLPKIFRPVTLNTLISLFDLRVKETCTATEASNNIDCCFVHSK